MTFKISNRVRELGALSCCEAAPAPTNDLNTLCADWHAARDEQALRVAGEALCAAVESLLTGDEQNIHSIDELRASATYRGQRLLAADKLHAEQLVSRERELAQAREQTAAFKGEAESARKAYNRMQRELIAATGWKRNPNAPPPAMTDWEACLLWVGDRMVQARNDYKRAIEAEEREERLERLERRVASLKRQLAESCAAVAGFNAVHAINKTTSNATDSTGEE